MGVIYDPSSGLHAPTMTKPQMTILHGKTDPAVLKTNQASNDTVQAGPRDIYFLG